MSEAAPVPDDVPGDPHDDAGEPVSPEEMAEILRANRAMLMAYFDRNLPLRLRRVVEPADMVQEVYLEAFRRVPTFRRRDDASTKAWLKLIGRTRLINLVAMANARKRGGGGDGDVPGDPGDDELLLLLEELSVYERTPSRSALDHEAAAAVEASLGRLPEHYCRALRLRYVEGASYAAIGQALGDKTEAAAKMVCSRALDAMRDDLGRRSRYL